MTGLFIITGVLPSASGIVSDMPPPASIGLLTTSDVAKRLNVSRRRVQQLIDEGRLPTQRVGDMHVIQPADLERVQIRKVGRPRQEKADASRRATLKKAGVPLEPTKRRKRKG